MRAPSSGCWACRKPPTGKRIAVIGAGPTGLACAYYLALLGHEAVVYESNAMAGGMLRYALPDYRLPKDALDREIGVIEAAGVKFVFNTVVGRDVMLNDLAANMTPCSCRSAPGKSRGST